MLGLLSRIFGRPKPPSKLASIIAEIPHHIAAAIVVRSPNGEIEYMNSYIEVLTGYAQKEFTSVPSDFLREIIHEKDRSMYDRCIAVASSGEQFEQTVRLTHQTGIELFAEIRALPILGSTGEVSSVMLVLLNVTGAIRYQQTIEEKNKDLADFTLMLSHDLKAPIFSIKGLIPVVAEKISQTDGEAFEALEHVRTSTKRLDQLISGVLEYARVSEAEVEMVPVDLNQILAECLTSVESQLAAAGCQPVVSSIPMVRGDRLRLSQIFANLISNSIKYRASGRALAIQISGGAVGSSVRIEFSDNGSGIPAAKLSGVFRPFQRAHGAHIEGAGIGLALVKRLVSRLRGEVEISSLEGAGTTVTLTFQRAPGV